MRSSLLVGIDLGATATRVVVVDPDRGVVATESRATELYAQRAGWAEADPRQWWRSVGELVPRVLKHAGGTAAQVAAVAASGTVPAVVLADANGRPLRRAILPDDARAVDQVERMRTQLAGVDLPGLTGSALTRQSVAPTLVWLATHEPEALRQASAVLGSYDWLARVLGAEPHVETNWALGSGLYTLDGELAEQVLDAAALSGDRLPAPRRPGTQVGAVTPAAADATGLAAGTPIVVGGADHVLSAYASGLTDPGDWLVELGDAGDILAVSAERLLDPRLYLDEHPVPGRWLPNGRMATSGSLLRWFQQLVGGAELSALDAEAQQRTPASIVCQPYLLGEKSPLHDPELRGSFVGLHLGHDRADVYRACLEAIAYGFRQHADVLTERGVQLGLARVTGGRSVLWKQILADVLGRPLYPVAAHPGAALGAAAAAGVGSGLYTDWVEGAGVVRLGSPVEPSGRGELAYDEGYQVYLSLQQDLRDASHRLAARSRTVNS